MDTTKKVRIVRPPVRNGIELIVGTDRVTLKVDHTVDDAELKSLEAFAQLVADKCGKSKVILVGKVERTSDGYSTVVEPLGA